MKKSSTVLDNELRAKYLKIITEMLKDEEIMQIASNELCFPVTDSEQNDKWMQIVVKVPKWEEDDDGYAKAEEYRLNCLEKQQKKAEAEKKKEEKKRKDAEERERKKREREALKARVEGG